jgi:HAD superfamily phosphatase (TIGR01668 family)
MFFWEIERKVEEEEGEEEEEAEVEERSWKKWINNDGKDHLTKLTTHVSTQQKFEALKAAYPGRRLLIVSNTAGAKSHDTQGKLAKAVEAATGVTVLAHAVKKPGCGDEIMAYFRAHPETGVTGPQHVAVVGDRLATDMMLANGMGSWGVWVRDGVVPLAQKSLVSGIFFSILLLSFFFFRFSLLLFSPSTFKSLSSFYFAFFLSSLFSFLPSSSSFLCSLCHHLPLTFSFPFHLLFS